MDYERLAKKNRKKPIANHSESKSAVTLNYSRDTIKKLIQHREPFLFVDEIVSADMNDLSAIGKSYIDPDNPVFKGHFPGNPIFPGVLTIETIGQFAICCFSLFRGGGYEITDEHKKIDVRIMKIQHSLFQYEVLPGDELTLVVKAIEQDDFIITGMGQAIKDNKVCAVVIGEFYIVE